MVKCLPGVDVATVRQRLKDRMAGEVEVLTKDQFATMTWKYWVLGTGMGMALGLSAGLAFAVGIVIVGQTIFTSVLARLREYATLKAVGFGNGFVVGLVALQSAAVVMVGLSFGDSGHDDLRPFRRSRRHRRGHAHDSGAAAEHDSHSPGDVRPSQPGGRGQGSARGAGEGVPMNVLAELRDVSKSYGSGDSRVEALRHISLQFHAGQVTLIEGPSGGGKTTLLEILGLLLPPDQGQVIVAGRDWSHCGETELTAGRRAHVAFIFQDFNLLDSLSARDNIAVVADLHGGDGRAVTQQIVGQVGLKDREHHRPGQMSGGQKQRVSIGRALASRGQLVLADEPTANLDWSIGEPIIKILCETAHKDHRCVIIVSHDARLEPYADRVVRLADGRIQSMREINSPVSDLTSASTAAPMTADSCAPRRRPRRGGLWLTTAAALLALGGSYYAGRQGWGWGQLSQIKASSQPDATTAIVPAASDPAFEVQAAAPAVIEPAARVTQISSDRPGIIRRIAVKAGDNVEAGQILFELDTEEARSQVELREADLAMAQAQLDDLKAGTRAEKREEALAIVQAAQARLAKCRFDFERIDKLQKANSATVGEVQDAQAALDVAKADVRRTQAMVDLTLAGPTTTELKQAEARVAQAKALRDSARVSLEQRTVRSPTRGRVLYIYRESGEVVNFPTPTPVLSIGAAGNLRLRAEVDETDISLVHVGQRVLATSESYPDRQFHGQVLYMEDLMGQRNIRTNRPRERQDVRVREIVIELDAQASNLPIDLLMTVQFLADKGRKQD